LVPAHPAHVAEDRGTHINLRSNRFPSGLRNYTRAAAFERRVSFRPFDRNIVLQFPPDVEFKTVRQLDAQHVPEQYVRQVALYCEASSVAMRAPARGVVLVV